MEAGTLDRLALELEELRQELLAAEAQVEDTLSVVHPENLPSARNLVHYLALRRHDLRALQLRLARAGLSSLGRSEAHVLVTIDQILAILAMARDAVPRTGPPDAPAPPVRFREGERILIGNARRLLGKRPRHRNVRIVVTLPSEAAEDPRLVSELVGAGMDCARINTARDGAEAWGAMAENVRSAEAAHGRGCRILADLAGSKLRTGEVAGGAKRLLLAVGDRLEVVREDGTPTRQGNRPRIACAASEVFDDARAGQPIWFDDGRIGGVIEDRDDDRLVIRVTTASPGGSKLRPRRGINLPETELKRAALTDADVRNLGRVAPWADAVGLSFVQSREDVLALQEALRRLDAEDLGIVLKIETRRGFEQLPQLLLAGMRHRSCGVMIARGDLAVEAGFERMAEIQEEILWIAEAAHVPTIWATQVLDDLAKEGTLTRAEMTDAAMSARAEAVMLNKGPFIVDAIETLGDILRRMKEHQSKKRPLFRALRVTRSLWS